MRLPLNRCESEHFKPIYDNYIQKEDTLDYVIPDTCADVKRILDVRGQLFLLSKKASEDRVIICMSVRADVIYEPDGGGEIQRVSAVIAADRTVTVAGATSDTSVNALASLCSVDARTINPRKLNIRCEALLHLRCWNLESLSVCSGAGEDAPICLLQKNYVDFMVTGVREKFFSVSDEYRIPEDKPQNAQLISSATEISVLEVKPVGNKLIFKSAAVTNAIFMCRESGRLFDTVFSSVFSQLIEIEGCGENTGHSVTVQVCDASLVEDESAKGLFSAEISVFAQAVCCAERESAYIADVYSNVCDIECETAEIEYCKLLSRKSEQLTLRGRLPICAELTELCYLSACAVCAYAENGRIRVEALVTGVGKDEDGDLCAPRLKLDESLENDCRGDIEVRLDSVRISGALITSGFDITIEVDVDYSLVSRERISAVAGIETGDEAYSRAAKRPSVTVICSNRGEALWDIAKRCGSTVELITAANTEEGVFDPERRPLLVPKA